MEVCFYGKHSSEPFNQVKNAAGVRLVDSSCEGAGKRSTWSIRSCCLRIKGGGEGGGGRDRGGKQTTLVLIFLALARYNGISSTLPAAIAEAIKRMLSDPNM